MRFKFKIQIKKIYKILKNKSVNMIKYKNQYKNRFNQCKDTNINVDVKLKQNINR